MITKKYMSRLQSKSSIQKSVSTAVIIGGAYLVMAVMYIYLTTGWSSQSLHTMDEYVRFDRIQDLAFIILTTLVLLTVAFLVSYRMNSYADFVVKQQEALIQSEQKAFAAIFAASVAHDSTNIITSLRFCIDLLDRNSTLNDSSKELVSTMRQALQSLSSLNRRLMDSCQQGIVGQLTYANLSEEIEKTVRLAKINGRVVNCTVKTDMPETLFFDMNVLLMSEALLNLVLNAADAVENEGDILIKIDQADKYVILEVHDNGPGIPFSLQDKIFDPFFTTKNHGTGLGLLTVKACAELHKGWVEVSKSPILGGALFRIWIPMQASKNQIDASIAEDPTLEIAPSK